LLGTFIAFALLVSTNLGEFWPFSIYPMFSQAGKPWQRAIVRDVSDVEPAEIGWHAVGLDALPGEAYPVESKGINQNDVANFLSKTPSWSQKRIAAFRRLFGNDLTDRTLLAYKVRGMLQNDGSVDVTYMPWVLMMPDSTILTREVALQ